MRKQLPWEEAPSRPQSKFSITVSTYLLLGRLLDSPSRYVPQRKETLFYEVTNMLLAGLQVLIWGGSTASGMYAMKLAKMSGLTVAT